MKEFSRKFAKVLLFPVAAVIGYRLAVVVGYHLEEIVSDKSTPWNESVIERRRKRHLESTEEDQFSIPPNIFDHGKKKSTK